MLNIKLLLEAQSKKYMSDTELALRAKLVKLLRTNHHNKYAERLKLFDVNIVPLKADPNFTAAIVFDKGTIYISEGFLQDPKTFNQLDMLMRHELSHNLLMHQIRLAKKIGEKIYPELGTSASLHELLNAIADFEISNTRYTDADKEIVRHTWLNGREISGLVTEDTRDEWKKLSLEEMYEKLDAELKAIQEAIISQRTWELDHKIEDQDYLTIKALGTLKYTLNSKNPSRLTVPAREFVHDRGGVYLGPKQRAKISDLPIHFQKVLKEVYKICTADDSYYLDQTNLAKLIDDIAQSKATEPFDLIQKDANGVENKAVHTLIISPEEKWFVLELLKSLNGNSVISKKDKPILHVKKATHSQEYRDIYNKIVRECGDKSIYSDADIIQLASELD